MAKTPQEYAAAGQYAPSYYSSAEGLAALRAAGVSESQIQQLKQQGDAYSQTYGAYDPSAFHPTDYQQSQARAGQDARQASVGYANSPQGQQQRSVSDPTIPGGAPTPSNYLEDLWKQYGSMWFAPSNQSASLPGLQQQLAGPGQAEQFYERALNTDSDPYYQRLQQQGMDSINQQMAARGHFNSGGAIAGLGNFESGLKAQQYHDLGGYANAAQQGLAARVGLSGQLANAADQTDTQRLQGAFQTAGSAQNLNMESVNNYLTAQGGLDQATAKLITDSFAKGGDLSSEAGRSAIEAQVKAELAKAGGTQAQQNLAMNALNALFTALAA